MSGPTFLEVTVQGKKLVFEGIMISAVLREEVDTAAELHVRLVCDGEGAKLSDKLKFGDAVKVTLHAEGKVERTVKMKLVELEDGWEPSVGVIAGFRAVDDLIKLKHVVQTKLWKVTPKSIVESIARDCGFTPVVQGVDGGANEVVQNNQSHAEMLQRIARDGGYKLTLDEKKLRFGVKIDSKKLSLSPDDRVYSVNIRRNITNIPTKVRVFGWDWRKQTKVVRGEASGSDLGKTSGGKSGPELAKKVYGEILWRVEAEKVLKETDAKSLARGLLQGRSDMLVSGEVECMGLPAARPGRLLQLKKFGSSSGTYRISRTVHRWSSRSGYVTTMGLYSDSTQRG